MFEAEFAFITYDYNKIRDLLSSIHEQDLKHEQDRLHFDYLRGLYALDGEKNDMTALYYFNNILSNRDIWIVYKFHETVHFVKFSLIFLFL